MPCISYYERNNFQSAKGDTMAVSIISYNITVWSKTIEELQENTVKVNEALFDLGFKRTSSNEYYDLENGILQKVMVFEILAIENY